MQVNDARDIWIPKGTKSEHMGSYIQKAAEQPFDIFADLKHGKAPYEASHVCRDNGRWFRLEKGASGNVYYAGESKRQPGPPREALATSELDTPMPATAVYFHAFAGDTSAMLKPRLSVHLAYKDRGRVR